MKAGYYLRLAWTNIGKNKRLYIPQILIGICLEAVMYIMFTLMRDENIQSIRGGAYIPTMMAIGIMLISILSAIMMLYTNSFLMKQRKREYGLYNVLGMGKGHICGVMFFESLITSVVVLVMGLLCGLVLYKLCVLFICKIMNVDTILGLIRIEPASIISTLSFFVLIFVINFIYNLFQMIRLKPVELLQSVHAGEKEPKTKWISAVIGVVALGIGYYIALSTQSPLKAINIFFVAVFLVIIGTYCLFVSGTIVILKLLKKNHKVYYQPNNMTAISGLLYRMKQNAVGLASICILSTCVLVMVSSTVSLYAGIEDMIRIQIPYDLEVDASYEVEENGKVYDKDAFSQMDEYVRVQCDKYGIEIEESKEMTYLSVAFLLHGNELLADMDIGAYDMDVSRIVQCQCVSLSEYNRLTGEQLSLKPGEIAMFEEETNTVDLPEETVLFGETYHKIPIDSFPIQTQMYSTVNVVGIVFCDEETFDKVCEAQRNAYEGYSSSVSHIMAYNFVKDTTKEQYENLSASSASGVGECMDQIVKADVNATGAQSYMWNLKYEQRSEVYGLYGSLLFLGILLGMVFIFATVLIIYYKQISEGYEDRDRFQIMLKVGMGHEEVKRTIKSQIVIVFCLPLLMAAVHVAVAFPILTKLLEIFFLPQTALFLGCMIITYIVFSIVYVVIYYLTARIYYKIVSK